MSFDSAQQLAADEALARRLAAKFQKQSQIKSEPLDDDEVQITRVKSEMKPKLESIHSALSDSILASLTQRPEFAIAHAVALAMLQAQRDGLSSVSTLFGSGGAAASSTESRSNPRGFGPLTNPTKSQTPHDRTHRQTPTNDGSNALPRAQPQQNRGHARGSILSLPNPDLGDPRVLRAQRERLEFTDPSPDLHTLFREIDDQLFFGRLQRYGVRCNWATRKMTSCAGICKPSRDGDIEIRLAPALLELRTRSDLIDTLVHEMIHAIMFIEGTQDSNEQKIMRSVLLQPCVLLLLRRRIESLREDVSSTFLQLPIQLSRCALCAHVHACLSGRGRRSAVGEGILCAIISTQLSED